MFRLPPLSTMFPRRKLKFALPVKVLAPEPSTFAAHPGADTATEIPWPPAVSPMNLAVGLALTGQLSPFAVRVTDVPAPEQPENETAVTWPTGFVPVLVGTMVAVEDVHCRMIPVLVSLNWIT